MKTDRRAHQQDCRAVSAPCRRRRELRPPKESDADEIGALVAARPTTLYIYPEAADVRAAAAGGGYWDASCRAEIGAPKFWSRAVREPIIARHKAAHPGPPPRPTPLCTGE